MKLPRKSAAQGLIEAGERLIAAQRKQQQSLETLNNNLQNATSASKITGDLVRQSMVNGDDERTQHFIQQMIKADTSGKKLLKRSEKHRKHSAAEVEKLEVAYSQAMERYNRQVVLRYGLFMVGYTLFVVSFLSLHVWQPPAINPEYFSLTAQIFPVIFIALYLEKPRAAHSFGGVWTKLRAVFTGLSASVYGTAASLVVVATGHFRSAGLWITTYCFIVLMKEIFSVLTKK